MNDKGRITVVTVVKNCVCHIEETILNVIKKKATVEIDYIVIDGGSTDGTADIIRRYADQILYWISEPDKGIYDAMNKGWAAAADDSFILFLGAGDRIISLPKQLVSYTHTDVIYGSVQIGKKSIFKARADFHLKLYNSLHHQALLVNKAIHPVSPFNCRYEVYADFDFNQRLKKGGANFVYSSEFMGYARPGGVSDEQNFAESLRVIWKNFGVLWSMLAAGGWVVMKILPPLKRLRPFHAS